MAQMKRNCLTEENIKGFLKMEVHQTFNGYNQRKYFCAAPGGEMQGE